MSDQPTQEYLVTFTFDAWNSDASPIQIQIHMNDIQLMAMQSTLNAASRLKERFARFDTLSGQLFIDVERFVAVRSTAKYTHLKDGRSLTNYGSIEQRDT